MKERFALTWIYELRNTLEPLLIERPPCQRRFFCISYFRSDALLRWLVLIESQNGRSNENDVHDSDIASSTIHHLSTLFIRKLVRPTWRCLPDPSDLAMSIASSYLKPPPGQPQKPSTIGNPVDMSSAANAACHLPCLLLKR